MKAIKTFCTSRPRYQNETTEKAPNIGVSGASFKVVLLYIILTSSIYFYIILYTLFEQQKFFFHLFVTFTKSAFSYLCIPTNFQKILDFPRIVW